MIRQSFLWQKKCLEYIVIDAKFSHPKHSLHFSYTVVIYGECGIDSAITYLRFGRDIKVE